MTKYEARIKRYDGTHIIRSDDKRKLDALAMSTRGIGATLTEQEREVFREIKQLQKEFQENYCLTCEHYNPEKKDFIEKGHENDPGDCINHWTDILGACWNYREREN